MPAATRYASYRRKSSLINGLTPVKAGNYGIGSSPRTSPKTVVFAPNVTPGTFTEPEPAIDEDTPLPPSPSDALFPPSLNPDNTQTRRRVPPGKRRSQGYIPRPPNAFMLFRADFVRQKHVPGSIETNHGSLSKIIGNCWRALPLEEKKTWENLAKQAKAKHQKLYPEYRFRPVHNKAKKQAREAAKAKAAMTPQDEQRCEDVAAMLLDGKKGDELAAAVRDYDTTRAMSEDPLDPMLHAPIPTHVQAYDSIHPYAGPANSYQFARRPSSVPLPNISIPSLPFYLPNQQLMSSGSRPESPISHYARSRVHIGGRRSSSAAPVLNRSWEMPSYFPGQVLQHDHDPLPEVPNGIFEQSFLGQGGFSWGVPQSQPEVMGFGNAVQQPDLALSISPLESVNINDAMSPASAVISPDYGYLTPNTSETYFNMSEFLPTLDPTVSSGPSSAFSGSPAPSDTSLPLQPPMSLHAPKPQHPVGFENWEQQQGGMEVMPMEDFVMDSTHMAFDPAAYAMGNHPANIYPCGPETTDDYHYQHDMSLEIPQY